MRDSFVAFAAVTRLELAELLRSRWLGVSLVVYGALAAVFVLVGLRESTVYGFTGTGRVLLSLTHALLLLLPLLALTGTAPAVVRAREDGTLEFLLSQPIPRGAWFAAVGLARYAALLAPLAATMFVVGLYGRFAHGQAVPWSFLARCLGVSAALLAAFCGLGLLIGARVRHAGRAALYALLAWLAAVALLDFALAGLMLQWRLPAELVFLLAGVNPVQAARLGLLSALDPELAILGPVGFHLSNQVGSDGLLLLGLAWPLAVGAATAALAWWSFRRADVV